MLVNNGLILQYGNMVLTNSTSNAKTLPISFTNAHYMAVATRYWLNADNNEQITCNVGVKTLTKIGVYTATGTNHGAYYICIGK